MIWRIEHHALLKISESIYVLEKYRARVWTENLKCFPLEMKGGQ